MKNEKQLLARNYYFQEELTQAQIAEKVGVSQKTISSWVNEGRWKRIKEMEQTTPVVIIEELYNELAEINNAIRLREAGRRFATAQEAEVRRKLLASVRYVKEQQNAATHMEVLMNFTQFIRACEPAMALPVTLLADRYLKGEKQIGRKNKFIPYDLPGDEETEEEISDQESEEGDMAATEKEQMPGAQSVSSPEENTFHHDRSFNRKDKQAMQRWKDHIKMMNSGRTYDY